MLPTEDREYCLRLGTAKYIDTYIHRSLLPEQVVVMSYSFQASPTLVSSRHLVLLFVFNIKILFNGNCSYLCNILGPWTAIFLGGWIIIRGDPAYLKNMGLVLHQLYHCDQQNQQH